MIIPKDIVEKFEKLIGDEEEVTFQNTFIKGKEYREMEKITSDYSKKKKNVLVFWDDILQFTTLGLVDCLMDYFKVDESVDFDLRNYFFRGVENSNYITFTINVFRELFQKELTEDFIKKFEKKYYPLILQKSPVAAAYGTFIKMYPLHAEMFICFRYNFDGCRELCESIFNQIPIKAGMSMKFGFLEEHNGDEYEFMMKNGERYDIIMIQDLSKAFRYLDDIDNEKERILMAPHIHNGVHEDYFAILYEMTRNVRVGPFKSTLCLFRDKPYSDELG